MTSQLPDSYLVGSVLIVGSVTLLALMLEEISRSPQKELFRPSKGGHQMMTLQLSGRVRTSLLSRRNPPLGGKEPAAVLRVLARIARLFHRCEGLQQVWHPFAFNHPSGAARSGADTGSSNVIPGATFFDVCSMRIFRASGISVPVILRGGVGLGIGRPPLEEQFLIGAGYGGRKGKGGKIRSTVLLLRKFVLSALTMSPEFGANLSKNFQNKGKRKEVKKMKGIKKYGAIALGLALTAPGAFASGGGGGSGDITEVIDGASSTLTAVIGVCITAAVFFVGLRIAKRVTRG